MNNKNYIQIINNNNNNNNNNHNNNKYKINNKHKQIIE